MLIAAAQNLNARGDLRPGADRGATNHAVTTDVDASTDLRLRVSEESTEGNPA
jgi:hypothetical protein